MVVNKDKDRNGYVTSHDEWKLLQLMEKWATLQAFGTYIDEHKNFVKPGKQDVLPLQELALTEAKERAIKILRIRSVKGGPSDD